MKKRNTYLQLFALLFAIVFIVSCSEDDPIIEEPLAFFSSEVSADDNLTYTFANESMNGDSYLWDFGDGSGTSTEMNPTYTYPEGGDYTVVLTVENGGGTDTHQETITVLDNAPVNLIQNGGFDDDSNWTTMQLFKLVDVYGAVEIADGTALWTETEAGPWKHFAIYQELTLEAGTYNIDMFVEYDGINEIWGEVFVGATIPTPATESDDSDYSDNKVLNILNGWNCAASYSGSAVESACQQTDDQGNPKETGEFTIDAAGTYYVVIKIGGSTYGENGIKVDDVSLYKQ